MTRLTEAMLATATAAARHTGQMHSATAPTMAAPAA